MPPATITLHSPARMLLAAIITACRLEPQTLLIVVAGVLTGKTGRRILVHLLGGDLELEWSEADNHVYMTGPAEFVFRGTAELD
mgnify:CR=1 FL=1